MKPKYLQEDSVVPRIHPRTVNWFGITSVAMGGCNQSLFLIGALFVGQGSIPGQGSAAVVLLIVGLLMSWAATPGWTELVMMYPHRVGGISATCAQAFKPYSPILANLTGVCYWWGWVPTCGVTALLAASGLHQWYFPFIPIPVIGIALILFFTFVNLCGVKWAMRVAMPLAIVSGGLAFLAALIPILSGRVDWHQAFTYHLTVPFPGWFGKWTSIMAGIYLVGFAAPAYEQATSHVGEAINQNTSVPKAIFISAAIAGLYFMVLPVVWLGALGQEPLGGDLSSALGPVFAPLFGSAAKGLAMWFITLNMFHGILAPLAGPPRVLSQLADDGLLPEFFGLRLSTDAPWVTTLLTAFMAIIFLFIGDPVWLIAAANLTYLIGIAMPNVAVWLLRRDHPEMDRPYRAPYGTIALGLLAAMGWLITTIFGFEQFGLKTVLAGITFAYAGSLLYAWRKMSDRKKMGLPMIGPSLHIKLTGAMLLVLSLDAIGYFIAVSHVPTHELCLIAVLEDIFVIVALLTIGVGLVLPGMIAHTAGEVSDAADKLVKGTLADFARAMQALAVGDLKAAKADFKIMPVKINSHDEISEMAIGFNNLQEEIGKAAEGLHGAREGLLKMREELYQTNELLRIAEKKFAEEQLERLRHEHAVILSSVEQAKQKAELAVQVRGQFLANMSHEIRTPMNAILGFSNLLSKTELSSKQKGYLDLVTSSGELLLGVIDDVLDISKLESNEIQFESIDCHLKKTVFEVMRIVVMRMKDRPFDTYVDIQEDVPEFIVTDPMRLKQVIVNLVGNAIKFTSKGEVGVIVEILKESSTELELKFTVKDTGIGIPQDKQEKLFKPFSQADESTTRKYGGTGLGLAISKSIVEKMGGKIWWRQG